MAIRHRAGGCVLSVVLLASPAYAFLHFDDPRLACRVHLDRTVTFRDPQTQNVVQFQASYRDICDVDHYARFDTGHYTLFTNGLASHRYYFGPYQQYSTTVPACSPGTSDWPLCDQSTGEPDRGYRYPHVANAPSSSNVQDLANDWWPVCASADASQIVSDPGSKSCGAFAQIGLCLPSAHYFERLEAPMHSGYPAQHFYSFVLTHADCAGCAHDPFSEIYTCKQLCQRYFGNLGFYCDRKAPDTTQCVWRDRHDLAWRENCVAHGGTNCNAQLRWADHGLDQVALGTEAEVPFERKTPLDSCIATCGPPNLNAPTQTNATPCGFGKCCLAGSSCCQRYTCNPATDPNCACFPQGTQFCRCEPGIDPFCTFNPACNCDPATDPACTSCDPSTQSCCDPGAECCDPATHACAPGTACCKPKPPWVSDWQTPPPDETQNAWRFAIWGRGRNPNDDFWGFLRSTAVNTDKPYDFGPVCSNKTLGPYCNEMIPTGGDTVKRDQKRALCKKALLTVPVDLDGDGQPDPPIVFDLAGQVTAATSGFCEAGAHGRSLCEDTCYNPEEANGFTNPDHECGNATLCQPGGICHLEGTNPQDCNGTTATCLCQGQECFQQCGDGGTPDAGEECDPGTHLPGNCCLATCRFALGAAPCNAGNAGAACSPPAGGRCTQSGNSCMCQ